MLVAEKTYTPEDLLSMPDGKNYELVDGHLVERNMSQLSSWVGGQAYLDSSIFAEDNRRLGMAADLGYECFPDAPRQGAQAGRLVHPHRADAGGTYLRGLRSHPAGPRRRSDLAE